MADFVKLRAETEKRGKAVQAASERKAPPDRGLQADRKLRRSQSEDADLR